MKLEFFDRFSKNTQISNFVEIRSVGAELFHADGRTDRHDETDSRFRNFANAHKIMPDLPRLSQYCVICIYLTRSSNRSEEGKKVSVA